jgi:threonine dehydratase
MSVSADDVAAARPAVESIARRTPVLSSRTISERAGGVVALKAENLQRTGSFKIRGVAAKLAALGDGCAAGVVAASAGNHAQSLAAAARARGVICEVFVPTDAPLSKVEAARGQGAIVNIGGDSVDACLEMAHARARDGGLAFVHPFDDPMIVAGQGSLGLELLEDVPDLAKVVVPVGGGGLCAGIAIARSRSSACRWRRARRTRSRCSAASRSLQRRRSRSPTASRSSARAISRSICCCATRTASWSSTRTRPPRRWSC